MAGLGAAYSAGMRIPAQSAGIQRGGGAWPTNKYPRSRGGGRTRRAKEPSSSIEGRYEGGVSGRFVSDAERATRDAEKRKQEGVMEGKRFEAGEKKKAAARASAESEKVRKQQEKESARTAGIERDKAETERKKSEAATGISKAAESRKAKEYEFKKNQRKWIQKWENADRAWAGGKGDSGAIQKYMVEKYMSDRDIDPKLLEDKSGLLQFEDWYQQMMKSIPNLDRQENGGFMVTFPGQEPVEMSAAMIDGSVWAPYNEKHTFAKAVSAKEQAETGKLKAETRKLDRGGLSDKNQLARDKLEWQKKKDLIDYPELGAGAAEKIGAGYDTGPADSVVIVNKRTGEKLRVPRTDPRAQTKPTVPTAAQSMESMGTQPLTGPPSMEQRGAVGLEKYGEFGDIQQGRPAPMEQAYQSSYQPPAGTLDTNASGISKETTFTNADVWNTVSGTVRAGIDKFQAGMAGATADMEEAARRREMEPAGIGY